VQTEEATTPVTSTLKAVEKVEVKAAQATAQMSGLNLQERENKMLEVGMGYDSELIKLLHHLGAILRGPGTDPVSWAGRASLPKSFHSQKEAPRPFPTRVT
jgi:hypothetical protein